MSLWFVLGAAVGAMFRFASERVSVAFFGEKFPWGTLSANVMGSFILGVVWTQNPSSPGEIFVMSLCGAYTTFGGFIAQTHSRLRHSDTRTVGWVYGCLTLVLSIGAAKIGLLL